VHSGWVAFGEVVYAREGARARWKHRLVTRPYAVHFPSSFHTHTHSPF
jgi:hypothetical protein